MKKAIPTLWPFFVVIILAVALSFSPLGVKLEEAIGLRLLFWLRGPLPAPENVVVVSIDEDSAALLDLPEPDELSQWPRSVHAKVINQLTALGTKVIAIDIAFQETGENPEADQQLAEAIANANDVVLLKLMEKYQVDHSAQSFTVEQVSLPSPQFSQRAKAVASFTLPEQSVKKYAEVFKQTPNGMEPTMPVAALLVYAENTFRDLAQLVLEQASDNVQLKNRVTAKNDLILENKLSAENNAAVIGEGSTDTLPLMVLATDVREKLQQQPQLITAIERKIVSNYNTHQKKLARALLTGLSAPNPVYLNFYGPRHSITTIPYAQFFDNKMGTLPDLRDKAVFIGLSEKRTKQRDYFYTIFSGAPDRRFSGVEIAATLFANLLDNSQLHGLLGWQIATIILMIGGGIVGGLIWLKLKPWLTLFTAIILGYVLGWYVIFIHFYYWVPIVIPIFLLATPLLVFGALHHYRQSVKLTEVTASTLQQYLPNDVALQMRDNVEKIQHLRQVTQGVCLLTDLVGFTALAERIPAGQLHTLMNGYYREISQVIQRHNGTIANIVGDGLLALWTGIELNNELKNRACQAAVDIVKTLSTPEFKAFKTCIGIHGGEISLGNLGSEGHFEYAPVGDTINTTARVEAYNRTLGTQVLLTDAVGADIRLFRTRYHGKVLFKGKTNAVGVYELIIEDS